MADIRASAETAVAVLDQVSDISGVPQLIVRIVRSPGMVVNGYLDIKVADQFFRHIQRLRTFCWFDRDRWKVKLPRKLENFPRRGFVLAEVSHHPEIHGDDSM